MRSRVQLTAVLLLCITGSIRAAEEESGIQAVWKQSLDAWNLHDARACQRRDKTAAFPPVL
jgi:hypothetical protein